MTSRLSYASSPESDLELSPAPALPGTLGPPIRLKSSSDPSIATQDDTTAPPPYSTNYQVSARPLNISYFVKNMDVCDCTQTTHFFLFFF